MFACSSVNNRFKHGSTWVSLLGCRRRQEQDENESAETQQQPKRSRVSSRPAQQDDQQYSEWDGHIDKAAVNELLQREPDNPHHMHNIDRYAADIAVVGFEGAVWLTAVSVLCRAAVCVGNCRSLFMRIHTMSRAEQRIVGALKPTAAVEQHSHSSSVPSRYRKAVHDSLLAAHCQAAGTAQQML